MRELSEKGLKTSEILDILGQAFVLHFEQKELSFPRTEIPLEAVFLKSGGEVFHLATGTVE